MSKTNIIATIKVIRAELGMSLKGAKDICDAVPCVLIKDVTLGFAANLQNKLVDSGAKVAVQKMEDFNAGKPLGDQNPGLTDMMKGLAAELADVPVDFGTSPDKTAVFIQDTPGAQVPTKLVPAHIIATPVAQVLNLRDAKAIGQRVHGTSPKSVYRTIALNDRVKVAAKILKSGVISIRIETNSATKAEMDRIMQTVSWKETYGSIHIQAGEIPVSRVIGAVLMGLGVKFDRQVTFEGELVIDES